MFWICSQCKTFQFWNGAWGTLLVERPCSQCAAPALTPILPDFEQVADEVQVKPKKQRRAPKKPTATSAVAVTPKPQPLPAAKPLPKPKPVTPPVAKPTAPKAVQAVATEEDDGGGWLTAADLRAAKFQDLPGPALGAEGPNGIPANIRVAVQKPYRAQAFEVRRVRHSFVLFDGNVRTTYYSEERAKKNLKELLTDIVASVTTRGIHGNYGTVYRNRERWLPLAELAAVGDQPAMSAYVEYGFRNNNVDGGPWHTHSADGYREAPGNVTARINRTIEQRRGDGGVDLGDRIIVCQLDDAVYYTPDHYRTFFEFDGARNWTAL
jgi:hypothetical protein